MPANIKPVIDRRIVALQFTGGLAGLSVGTLGFWFLDFWVGAAVVSPFAVLVVVGWDTQRKQTDNSDCSDVPLSRLAFTLLIATCLAIHGLWLIRTSQIQQTNLKRLTEIPADSLARIVIQEPFSRDIIARIDDREALAAFCEAASDATVNWNARIRNSEHTRHLHFVMVDKTETSWIFEWSQSSPTTMFGMFAELDGNTVYNRGNFRSDKLRDWYREYLEPVLNENR